MSFTIYTTFQPDDVSARDAFAAMSEALVAWRLLQEERTEERRRATEESPAAEENVEPNRALKFFAELSNRERLRLEPLNWHNFDVKLPRRPRVLKDNIDRRDIDAHECSKLLAKYPADEPMQITGWSYFARSEEQEDDEDPLHSWFTTFDDPGMRGPEHPGESRLLFRTRITFDDRRGYGDQTYEDFLQRLLDLALSMVHTFRPAHLCIGHDYLHGALPFNKMLAYYRGPSEVLEDIRFIEHVWRNGVKSWYPPSLPFRESIDSGVFAIDRTPAETWRKFNSLIDRCSKVDEAVVRAELKSKPFEVFKLGAELDDGFYVMNWPYFMNAPLAPFYLAMLEAAGSGSPPA